MELNNVLLKSICLFYFYNMATRKFIVAYVAHICIDWTVLKYNVFMVLD